MTAIVEYLPGLLEATLKYELHMVKGAAHPNRYEIISKGTGGSYIAGTASHPAAGMLNLLQHQATFVLTFQGTNASDAYRLVKKLLQYGECFLQTNNPLIAIVGIAMDIQKGEK